MLRLHGSTSTNSSVNPRGVEKLPVIPRGVELLSAYPRHLRTYASCSLFSPTMHVYSSLAYAFTSSFPSYTSTDQRHFCRLVLTLSPHFHSSFPSLSPDSVNGVDLLTVNHGVDLRALFFTPHGIAGELLILIQTLSLYLSFLLLLAKWFLINFLAQSFQWLLNRISTKHGVYYTRVFTIFFSQA